MSEERHALVTGASTGFGLLTTVELAREGFVVFATMRDPARRERLDTAARDAGVAERVIVERLDVTEPASLAACVAKVKEKTRALSVLVNNAGYGLGGFAEDVSESELRAQFDTNFFGVVRTTLAFLPQMREAGRGTVVNLSSIAGRVGFPGLSSYHASKFAVEGWTESIRHEVSPYGVQVVLVEPGTFRTEIFDRNKKLAARMLDPSSPYFERSKRMQAMVEANVAASTADPADVARLITSIALDSSPALRYPIGTDAKLGVFFRWLLPERVFSGIIRSQAK